MKRQPRSCMFSVHISHQGHDLRVTGTVCPPEPATWSERDGGYPGCPACIEDVEIFLVRGKRERRLQDPDGKLWDAVEDDVAQALGD